uniref:arylacetamide deacetylase-like 4 isoform X3 n=1 Tax=Monopterus albus TaxID=43700 RepID=UPI0009B365B0|nr:arylacetamide deacetylase-like 4 isoform X3 [Monopterus albus]
MNILLQCPFALSGCLLASSPPPSRVFSVVLNLWSPCCVPAFLLLVIGLVYSELMNSDIPRGVTNRRKLHLVHGLSVGIAVVGRILHRMGICHQVSFIRWFIACFLTGLNPLPAGLRVKDLKFSEVPVRVYEPTTVCNGLRRGLVYFHGGGWVLGSIDSVDEVCRHVAKESDTTVVSVGYRLAPEHRYPAQLDDCEAATCHFLSVAEAEFRVDSRRVAVGGDSTGANLAAALCQRLARREDGHLPFPCAQDVLEGNHVPTELRPRYKKWLSPSNLPPECLARGFCEHPVPEYDGEVYHAIKAGLEPEVSPLLEDDAVIEKTPPTFILTCEYDVLRDDGILYRKRLLDLKKDVTWRHVTDGFHGMINYFNQGWLTFPCALQLVDSVAEYVKTL